MGHSERAHLSRHLKGDLDPGFENCPSVCIPPHAPSPSPYLDVPPGGSQTSSGVSGGGPGGADGADEGLRTSSPAGTSSPADGWLGVSLRPAQLRSVLLLAGGVWGAVPRKWEGCPGHSSELSEVLWPALPGPSPGTAALGGKCPPLAAWTGGSGRRGPACPGAPCPGAATAVPAPPPSVCSAGACEAGVGPVGHGLTLSCCVALREGPDSPAPQFPPLLRLTTCGQPGAWLGAGPDDGSSVGAAVGGLRGRGSSPPPPPASRLGAQGPRSLWS